MYFKNGNVIQMGTKVSAKNKIVAVINFTAFVAVVIINVFASTQSINGKTTGQVSNQYDNLFTPAGITFSIWGVIYFFLFGFIVLQAKALLRKDYESARKVLDISPWFVFSCLANIGWLFSWHYLQLGISVIIMISLLLSLIMIYRKLQLPLPKEPLSQKLWFDIPFSIYLGWVSVATIANVAAFLTSIEWTGFGFSPISWAIILIAVAAALGAYIIAFQNNFYYTLVILWALYGIVLKLKAEPGETNTGIILCANIGFIVNVILLVIKLYYKRYGNLNLFKNPTSSETSASIQN